MHQLKLLLVIFLLIFAVSCTPVSERNEEKWKEIALLARGEYLAFQQGVATCEVTADYGERVYNFEMTATLSSTEEGLETTLILTAPQELAGITVTKIGENSRLQWDSTLLETGNLAGISPVGVLPLFMESLQKGYIYSGKVEEMFTPQGTLPVLELLICDPDFPLGSGTEILLWLHLESYQLLGGEVYQDGKRVITCALTEFIYH